MEDVLDTYALAPDPDRPLVNFDEFSKQLLSEFIPPQAAKAFDWKPTWHLPPPGLGVRARG